MLFVGLTADRVYRLRLILEEYGPDKEHIKGVNNTVADAISCLDYNREVNPPQNSHHLQRLSDVHGVKVKHLKMKSLSKQCLLYHEACCHEESGKDHSSTSTHAVANDTTSFVFANRS